MASTTLLSVEQYLSTTYSPDCEYVEGRLLERNVGEKDHARLQTILTAFLFGKEQESGIFVVTEQRVQVTPERFRIPDICVVAGEEPREQIFTKPPFLCIEILSRDDTMQDMQDRVDDYLSFGVPFVWILNPRSRKAYTYTTAGMVEAKDGFLRTPEPRIEVPLGEIFGKLG